MNIYKHSSNRCLFFRKKPNLIIHLDVQPEESKRRIETRNRDCESGITLDYLQRLYSAYESFIKDISRIIPVIRVNYNEYRSADEMVDMILRWVIGWKDSFEISPHFFYHFHFIFVCMYAFGNLYVSSCLENTLRWLMFVLFVSTAEEMICVFCAGY